MLPKQYSIGDCDGVLPKSLQECGTLFNFQPERNTVVYINDGSTRTIYTWSNVETIDIETARSTVEATGVNPSSSDDIEARKKLCASCPRYDSSSTMCRACGCYMRFKWTVKDHACPIKKW